MPDIALDRILPNPEQPRKVFDANDMADLVVSVQEHGVIQPVVVEQAGDDYILHDGERRTRAARLAGLTEIPAVIVPPLNGSGAQQRLLRALVANVQRADLDPIEEAQAYARLRDEHGFSQNQIARQMGKPIKVISDRLALLDLEEPIQRLIAVRQLPRDRRVRDALMAIPDAEARLLLARKLAGNNANIPSIVKAANRLSAAMTAQDCEKKDDRAPALRVSRLPDDMPEWDALFQAGRVPPWPEFNDAVQSTCDACPYRSIASDDVCGACPLPEMITRLLKGVGRGS